MNSSDILSKHDPFKIMIHHHQKTPSSPFPSPGKVYFLGLMTLSYIVGELTHFLINTTSRYVIIIVIIIIMFVIILVKIISDLWHEKSTMGSSRATHILITRKRRKRFFLTHPPPHTPTPYHPVPPLNHYGPFTTSIFKYCHNSNSLLQGAPGLFFSEQHKQWRRMQCTGSLQVGLLRTWNSISGRIGNEVTRVSDVIGTNSFLNPCM